MINRIILERTDFEKYISRQRSFYNEDYIDRAAKAVLPLLDQWLAGEKNLYHTDFAKEYLARLEKEFGEDLTSPLLYFKEMFLAQGGRSFGKSFHDPIKNAFHTTSMWMSEGDWKQKGFLSAFENNPRLNSIFIIHPEDIKQLQSRLILSRDDARKVAERVEKNKNAIFSCQRAPAVFTVVIVARNYDEALKDIQRLSSAKTMFKGFID